ncbi:MAG: hypothetical protein J0J01_27740 [Reyranella sp.]|uniref:hypothetical protein n=1 Tax=Reyranella sp. TaxID=1929291 RepID=UPI001AD3172B|nr:hypothetical protein [Reyranella sp.]MBN9090722.1 hypothetical protein [Reyranella sp.]
MFNSKTDILCAILIAFLTVLAGIQVQGLVLTPRVASAPPATQVQYTVERSPEIRPEAPPPRTPGRSSIRVARAHTLDATN